ncbi:MAG: tRNA lysidine(34) synthetase TilS [Synergistaceae bacterium]|nr:tRNA lysidine(34) synthetase TilS [Synergistaceae bacterium]
MGPEAQKLYSRAMSRLSPEGRDRERAREIPYPLSLHALAPYFHEMGTRQGWLPVGEKPLLMAVSGGGDSVAMLWLFHALYGGPIIVAHVNHGIRGRDSDGDAAFVKDLAGELGLPFVERRASVPSERERGESLETAARRVRHRELVSLADSRGAWGIATGHNRDDLAETALFHLLRGTGVRGGVGIPERRGPFFRPLLGLRREFLRQFLRVRGLPWREDATNGDTDLTRNFIRLELLPLMEARVNAGAVDHIADFARDLSQWRDDEDRRGKALLESAMVDRNGGGLTLSRKTVAELSPFERALVLREAGRTMRLPTLSRRRLEELSGLIQRKPPFIFQWKRGAEVIGRGGMVRWSLK